VLTRVNLSGFPYGIKSVATSGTGSTVVDSTVASSLVGVALGTTTGATITGTSITGGTATTNTSFGIDGNAGDVTVEDTTIAGYPTGIRSRATAGSITVDDVSIRQAIGGGIVLTSLDGVTVTDVSVGLTGVTSLAATGSALSLGASQTLDIDGFQVTGYPTAIGSGGVGNAGPAKTGGSITNVTATGVTAGISLSNFGPIAISDVSVETNAPKGSGVYLRETDGVSLTRLTVRGTAPAPGDHVGSGTHGVRTYYSTNVSVVDSDLAGGSTGFYWDMTKGVTVTGARVSEMSWNGVYSENVLGWTMTGSHFFDNAAVGNLTINPTPPSYDPRNERTTSSDVHWSGNTFDGTHHAGVYLPLGFGGFELDHNTVSGVEQYVVLAVPAHNIDVHDNAIDFTGANHEGAVRIGGDTHDNLDTDDPTSSGIRVTDNVFAGAGPFVRTGSALGVKTALADTVMVQGNTFPADSVAISSGLRSGGTDGVAVDARDHDNPNDWGSVCRATNELEGYLGEGARIIPVAQGQVLSPKNCIDLSVVEGATERRTGDLVSWTLTPHNEGLVDAPKGWTVTQLLPAGVELVGMAGDGYTVDGLVATAEDALAHGSDGPVLTVTVRVTDAASGSRTFRNVAYVAPLAPADAFDLDDDGNADVIVEHHNPLVVPTIDTDTVASATNNDTEGSFTVGSAVLPRTSDLEGYVSEVLADAGPSSALALTGGEVTTAALIAALLVGTGALGRLLGRRHAGRQD
jgi:hypothetical protein